MKIKQKLKRSDKADFVYNLFTKNKILTRGLLTLFGIIGLITLFFIILDYGAHLNQTGQTSFIKNTVLKVANLDFSFVKKYTKGQLQKFDNIQMDIKFKHLQRIQYLREQALIAGVISSEIKSEEFPVTISLNGITHNAKISLTGLMAEPHLRDPMRWSFQVKVSGDDTFKGMKRFGMLRPATRGYMTDWLGYEIMKERGLIGLRVDFVHLTVNGKPIGIYYLEERFDKYLLESNSLRDGIIFKLDDTFMPYQESKLMNDPQTKAQLLLVRRMCRDMMAGEMHPGSFFDLKKMAQVFALCDLMNNKHPLSRQNMRYYFNPVTGLVEPIVREWEPIRLTEVSNLRLFIEQPIPLSRHARFTNDPVLKLIYDNLEFKKQYIREAEILSQTEFLDQFLRRKEDAINYLISKVYRTWPFYKLYQQKLYENQNYIRSVLFPEDDQLAAYFSSKEPGTLQIRLQNQQYLPIEVTYLSWQDSVLFHPNTPIVLDSKVKEQPKAFNFQLPESIELPEDYLKDLKVHYNVYGLKSRKRTIEVLPKVGELKTVDEAEILVDRGNYSSFDFVETSVENQQISIPQGEWTISKDMIIPANMNLEIDAGANIDLIKGARIICYSHISANGQEGNPINIVSSDSSGRGVAVIQADQQSVLSYVNFDKIGGDAVDDGVLKGAVTFYESPVSINFSTFSNGRGGREYLHICRSDFFLNYTFFKNIDNNALVVDYSKGTIFNSSFVNISMDGITTIRSTLSMQQLFLNNIRERALVARENSQLNIRQADIRYSGIGIVASGQSELRLFDTFLDFKNKRNHNQEENLGSGNNYTGSEPLESKNTSTSYKIESGSKILLDGVSIEDNKENMLDRIIKVLQ